MKSLSIPAPLKILLLLKAILVLGVAGYHMELLKFGDKTIWAADEGGNESVNESEQSAASTEKAGSAGGNVASDAKKLLDEIFSLPEINSEQARKDEIGRYLTLLESKKQQIEDRLSYLKEREGQLVNIERVIDDKLKKLDEERKFFAESLQQEKKQNEERLNQLVEFYKKMTPKKAAPVFENLDRDLVVQLFKRLPEKQIMSILSLMNPEKSVELTEYYGRIGSGKEYEILGEINEALRDEFAKCKS